MTAHDGPELWTFDEGVHSRWPWHFNCGNILGGIDDGGLTGEETITSAASEGTLQGNRGFRLGSTLEDHEVGPGVTNPGPPFAVGDVIHCNVGSHGLQRAFIIMSDHPHYQLRLEVGITVKTSIQEAWMAPCLNNGPGNPNDLAPDADNPFTSIRHEVELGQRTGKQRMGSYGVHIDAQRNSLLMVEEAKAFA
jgi:hypothetical protein